MFTKLVAVVALLFAVVIAAPVAAHASDDQTCTEGQEQIQPTPSNAPYCEPATQVLPSNSESGGATSGGGGSTSGGGTTGSSAEDSGSGPAVASNGGSAAASAPSGALPFTGGDVVGMAAIGAGALAIGIFMVRRSKRSPASSAA